MFWTVINYTLCFLYNSSASFFTVPPIVEGVVANRTTKKDLIQYDVILVWSEATFNNVSVTAHMQECNNSVVHAHSV